MPDRFMLEPDQIEPERPERRTPPRMVSTGLAPTADVPKTRGKEPPASYASCPACGRLVLRGLTTAGVPVVLDPDIRTYVVLWADARSQPTLYESRGYPAHGCQPQRPR